MEIIPHNGNEIRQAIDMALANKVMYATLDYEGACLNGSATADVRDIVINVPFSMKTPFIASVNVNLYRGSTNINQGEDTAVAVWNAVIINNSENEITLRAMLTVIPAKDYNVPTDGLKAFVTFGIADISQTAVINLAQTAEVTKNENNT